MVKIRGGLNVDETFRCPTQIGQPVSQRDALAELFSVLAAAGLNVKGVPVANGEIQRVAEIRSNKKDDDAGWYVVNELDNGLMYANYGCWRSGLQGDWNSRGNTQTLSPADRASIKKAKKNIERRRSADQAVAAENARYQWEQAAQASPEHPYLANKQITPNGLRQFGDDLLVPVAIGTSITSIQRINAIGSKRFQKDGQIKGGSFHIGEFRNRIILTEGFATAASIHQATGEGVAVAFNAGNLLAVAKQLRERFKLPIVIAGDDDRFTDGNPGRKKADAVAAQVDNVTCVYPSFSNDDGKSTDFNDLHCREGLDAVCEIFEQGAEQLFNAFTIDANFDPANLPVRPWLMPGLLMRGYVTAAVAPPGVGKSTFAAMIAIMVATKWETPDA